MNQPGFGSSNLAIQVRWQLCYFVWLACVVLLRWSTLTDMGTGNPAFMSRMLRLALLKLLWVVPPGPNPLFGGAHDKYSEEVISAKNSSFITPKMWFKVNLMWGSEKQQAMEGYQNSSNPSAFTFGIIEQ